MKTELMFMSMKMAILFTNMFITTQQATCQQTQFIQPGIYITIAFGEIFLQAQERLPTTVGQMPLQETV